MPQVSLDVPGASALEPLTTELNSGSKVLGNQAFIQQDATGPSTQLVPSACSPAVGSFQSMPEAQLDSDNDIEDDSQVASDPSSMQNSVAAAPGVRSLSSFQPTKHNIVERSEHEYTINLDNGTLCLIGHYDLWVRKGALSVSGAILYASPSVHRIYATSIHALPLIRPIRDPFGPPTQQTLLTIYDVSSGLRALSEISPRFSRLWNCSRYKRRTIDPFSSLFPKLLTSQFLRSSSEHAYSRLLHPLEPPLDWQPLVTTLVSKRDSEQPRVLLVCGPKGSGKSTFNRLLANSFLSKSVYGTLADRNTAKAPYVALLDIDPGQPEYSPPGEVSLMLLQDFNLGPPFSHPLLLNKKGRLLRSHHFGATTPRDDPEFYLRCVLDLLQHYRQFLAQDPLCPLIVNTTGWIQGSGTDILHDCIRHISPTDVVYTSKLGPLDVVESVSQAVMAAKASLHLVTSQAAATPSRSAADLRLMQTLSYFHLDEPEYGNLRWNPKPITKLAPLSVHYAGPNQSIYGVHALGPDLDPEFLVQALEGCLVALVVIEDDAALPFSWQESGSDGPSEVGENEVDINGHTTPSPHAEGHEVSMTSVDTPVEMIPKPNLASSTSRHFRSGPSPASSANPTTPNLFSRGSLSPEARSRERATTPQTMRQNLPPNEALPRQETTAAAEYNLRPALPRAPEGIPYIPSTHHMTPPLSPEHSHSIGQGLIRSIDIESHTLHLITPVQLETLNNLHQQQQRLVLVRGSLEAPTWAYKEDLYYEMARRKRLVKHDAADGNLENWGKGDTARWAEGRPWVRAGERRKGERTRRVRRDLGRKDKG